MPIENGYVPKIGDSILFADKDGDKTHACVYIADNLVYTKNGYDSVVNDIPFKFMMFEDVKRLYFGAGAKILFYKRVVGDSHLVPEK